MFPDRIIPDLCYKYHCSVPGCETNSLLNSDLCFHKFPDPGPYTNNRHLPLQHEYLIIDKRGYQHKVDRLTVWKTVLKISELTKDMRVCSLHFEKEDYETRDCRNKRPQLVKTAIPSCNLPDSHPDPLDDHSWRSRGRVKRPVRVDIRSFQKPFSTDPEPQLIDVPDEDDPLNIDGAALSDEPAIDLEVECEEEKIEEFGADEVHVLFHDHDYFKDSPRFVSNGCHKEQSSTTNEVVEVIEDCISEHDSVDLNPDDCMTIPGSSSLTDSGVENASARNVPVPVTGVNKRFRRIKSVTTQTEEKHFTFSYSYIERKAGLAYYTGLGNSKVFRFVLKSLGPAAYHLQNQWHLVDKISVENQLLITLIKLKRYTPSIELATMFDTHSTAVHNIFLTWVNFMAAEWKKLPLWPVDALINHRITPGFRTTPSRMGDPLFCFTISQATTQFFDFQDNLNDIKVSSSLPMTDSVEGERRYAENVAQTANKTFNVLKYKLSSRHEIVGREIFFVCCMLCIFNKDIVIEE